MDARAEELLRAIAAAPDDNAPRLAFAKHIETEAPAHAALIVAQCSGNEDPALVEAFRTELPEALRDHALELELENAVFVRGFIELGHWSLAQHDFLEIDPDVLFRVAPSCTRLEVGGVTDFEAVASRVRRFDTLVLHTGSLTARGSAAAAVVPYRYGLPIVHGERGSAWCSHERSAGFKVRSRTRASAVRHFTLFDQRRGCG